MKAIEIPGDLLYQTWIDEKISFSPFFYHIAIMNKDVEVERYRMMQVLEMVSSLSEGQQCFGVKLGNFYYDLIIKSEKNGRVVGFKEYCPEEYPFMSTEKRGYELIADHHHIFMKGLYEEDRETAVKLFNCSPDDFFKITINWEYEPGKRFYYYTTKTSFMSDDNDGLIETSCRKAFLLITPNRITQRGLWPSPKRRLPFNMLQFVYLDLSDYEGIPSLEELFDIYEPRLRYTLQLAGDIRFPQNIIIKKRQLYTLEEMAGYLLKGIPKEKAAQILKNIDDSNPNAQLFFINKAIKVSNEIMDAVDRILAHDPPYRVESIFKTPYKHSIILADKLGYQVDWNWPIETWELKSEQWEREHDELLTLLPKQVEYTKTQRDIENDDIPF